MPISFQQLIKNWSAQLIQYDPSEAENLVYWLLEHHLAMKRVDVMLLVNEEKLSPILLTHFKRLKTGEPIQYILRKAPFYGRDFFVTPDTLIPRNETEELVHLIIKENQAPGLKILDIGTGTGCIPITLALEMNDPKVYALDISEPALHVAEQNAQALNVNVSFERCDILKETPNSCDLDILVSNPPYVLESDKSAMHTNVLEHEPWIALFVSDEDPLLFYRVIAEKGKLMLRSGGKIYFEIHETQGEQIRKILAGLGYQQVNILQDLNGKTRMCSAILP
ncbi:peptide chain release factor N(5)-glutamine methyltransferase [Algoriphagus jejuensis]|uniref:Release factor glutamine methyltransferase n=1 Tax=Algoriphagus jejuensis TaxID=419934 RepID=A0ABN1N2S5_9BACT